MRKWLVPMLLTAGLLTGNTYAQADGYKAQSVEIVKRDTDGRVQVVRVEGQEYQVCVGERQDNCINPHAAGLNWGDRPLKYWPGKPASEIDEPLPENKPE